MRLRRAAAAALIVCALSSPWWPQSSGSAAARSGLRDVEAFRTIVSKTAAGEWFYRAEGETLHANGYPTASVFNWREPTLYLGLSWLGVSFARLWLGATIILLLVRVFRQLSPVAAVAVAHACLFVLADAPLYFTERWAGVCVGLSLMASLRGSTLISVGWAVAALSIRELAAPYCVIMTLLAVWERRRRDALLWLGGGVIYCAFFILHVWAFTLAVPPDARAHANSWIAFGGPPFLLDTLRVQGVFAALPRSALGPVLAALAVAPWADSMPRAVRVGGLSYIVFLMVAGQPFNNYWGSIAAPLLACWFAYVVDGGRTLLRTSTVASGTSERLDSAGASS